MTDVAVMAEGLGKRFGRVTVLDGVDLEVPAGSVLGLLGPNGAGKTTLVRILATLLKPDRGRARVAGYDVASQPQAVRRLIGLSGQYAAVDPFLTGAENLVMIGRLYGLTGRAARRRAAELTGRLVSAGWPAGWCAPIPGGCAAGAVPRRADDRSGPGLAGSRCGRCSPS